MVTLLLALTGCVLIGVSIFFLYRGSFYANQKIIIAKKDLDEAKLKIECLNNELKEKTNKFLESEQKLELLKSHSFNPIAGQNLPIVEITTVDLGEGTTIEGKDKKVHRLMFSHQIRFSILNIGKSSLKEVIFSIQDIYNGPKDKLKKNRHRSKSFNNEELGSYENIEVNTLNLKSKKMIYTSNLPSSFGVGDYSYIVIVEWDKGFYQMEVNIEEIDGKLNFKYQFFDDNCNEIDFKNLENSINN